MDAIDSVEDCTDGADVVLQVAKDRGLVAEDIDPFGGGYTQKCWHGSRKYERCAVDALREVKHETETLCRWLSRDLPGA